MTYKVLAEALDMLDYGLLVVDREGKVAFRNRAVARLLAESPAVRVSDGGHLTVMPATLALQVRKAIEAAAANGRIGALCVPGTQGKAHSLALVFAPLASTAVAVWLIDTVAVAPANAALLSALFRLSPAEAQLALRLVGGYTAEEHSRLVGVGMATVRSQLHSMFIKTGTRRQAALVTLLSRISALTLPPP